MDDAPKLLDLGEVGGDGAVVADVRRLVGVDGPGGGHLHLVGALLDDVVVVIRRPLVEAHRLVASAREVGVEA
jgi:hypothetical protein